MFDTLALIPATDCSKSFKMNPHGISSKNTVKRDSNQNNNIKKRNVPFSPIFSSSHKLIKAKEENYQGVSQTLFLHKGMNSITLNACIDLQSIQE